MCKYLSSQKSKLNKHNEFLANKCIRILLCKNTKEHDQSWHLGSRRFPECIALFAITAISGPIKMADEKSDGIHSEVNYDEAIIAQVDSIQKEIAESQDLISNKVDILNLLNEYSNEDFIYQAKIQNLSLRYSHIRKTRGDGNCLFRAFGYGYFEKLLNDKIEYERFKTLAAKSKEELVSLGFPALTIEDFHDVFMETLEMIGREQSTEELLKTFRDEGISNYLVVYLRLLTSAQLQKKAEFFENFIEGGRTVKEFCNQEVEPMARESDHIHIIALTDALGVCIRVEYVDRTGTTDVNHHDFPEDGQKPQLTLMYRPGHYDVLYKADI